MPLAPYFQNLIDTGKAWFQVNKHGDANIRLLDWVEKVSAKGVLTGGGNKCAVDTLDHMCFNSYKEAVAYAKTLQHNRISYAKIQISNANARVRELNEIEKGGFDYGKDMDKKMLPFTNTTKKEKS